MIALMSLTTTEKAQNTITTQDGTQIFYKDWGKGQPVVFSHGWPLNADAWDDQMNLVASNGFRGIAHDRRGGGRSSQPWDGNTMVTYACIKAFSETDLTEDLKRNDVPTLIIHGDDDQIVPIADSAFRSSKMIRNAILKVYPGAPHGLFSTHKDQFNADLLAFLKS